MPNCKIKNCKREYRAKGFCAMHYGRIVTRGNAPGGVEPKDIRHGMERHPLYHTWEAMRQRCNDPNAANYKWYGARGIKVCPQWRDFTVFLKDVGNRPKGLTLDRIDVNGNYEPNNVRWATRSEQRLNQRKAIKAYGTI